MIRTGFPTYRREAFRLRLIFPWLLPADSVSYQSTVDESRVLVMLTAAHRQGQWKGPLRP